MVSSKAVTVDDYVGELPEERRVEMQAMLKFVRKHMPKGYRESMAWGMISWEIPLETYPDTYNKRPLCYAALAAQKNHISFYLMGPYGDPAQARALQDAFAAAGKKLDMGKSCIRFKRTADLALPAIGKAIASMPPKKYIEKYEKSRSGARPTIR